MRDYEERDTGTGAFKAALFGTALGAVIGAFAVIWTDEKKRQQMLDKVDEFKSGATKTATDMKKKALKATDDAQEKLEEVTDTAQEKLTNGKRTIERVDTRERARQ